MPLQRGDVCPHAQFAQRAVCCDPDRFGTVGSDARRQQRDPVEHARGKGVPGVQSRPTLRMSAVTRAAITAPTNKARLEPMKLTQSAVAVS
ncbi:hypothetical protein D3C85_1405420 [compost metagenome]